MNSPSRSARLDGTSDDISLTLGDPLASATSDDLSRLGEHLPPATPDLSEHHPNIRARFRKPSARVLAGPTITSRLRELSTDTFVISDDKNHLFGQHIDLGPVETTLSNRPGRPMLETIKAFADLTPQTLDLIVKDYHGRVVFPNLKVKIPRCNDQECAD